MSNVSGSEKTVSSRDALATTAATAEPAGITTPPNSTS